MGRGVVVCPHCGGEIGAEVPENACQWLLDCPHCGALLKPQAGDCCVFCSYGENPCPPKQRENESCCG